MTLLPAGVKVRLAFGYKDMRKGMDGLALLVQEVLRQDPFSGHRAGTTTASVKSMAGPALVEDPRPSWRGKSGLRAQKMGPTRL